MKSINLLQLYPKDMNIYGDWGNTLVLKRRLEWHGYGVQLLEYNPDQPCAHSPTTAYRCS